MFKVTKSRNGDWSFKRVRPKKKNKKNKNNNSVKK